MKKTTEKSRSGRRNFLRTAGQAAVAAAALVGARSVGAQDEPSTRAVTGPVEGYDWSKHQWGYGIDTYRCIGCLRCVEACKAENGVALDAHHFRTWVERYVYLEGEEKARVDSHSDPDNIAASGSEKEYRFDNRYKDAKVEKAFFVPKICNHCSRPSCVQVCPTGATYKFNVEAQATEKCTWCYHRITKGLDPACVEVCPTGARIFGDMNDKESPISAFLRDNRVMVLKPEQGNAPTCFYIGIDKEVS
jgi:Fe-S-cluster-containing dehydrogenase component